MELGKALEFDHVIRVHDDGTITDEPNVWAPDLFDGELESAEWEFFSTGYSGQDSYSGPIMHASEFIGGQLERDILETPGVYVAVVSYYPSESDVEHNIITSRITGEAHCEHCGFGGCDDEPFADGWAIARKVEVAR